MSGFIPIKMPEDINDEFRNPANYGCPRCGLDGDFIFTSGELIVHGFTKNDAPEGICISCAEISNESGHWNSDTEYRVDSNNPNRTDASKLIFLDLSDEELEIKSMKTKHYSFQAQRRFRYDRKSRYRSALTEERYRKLNPPYFIGSRAWASSGIKSKEHKDQATFIDFKKDWFDNLLHSLMVMESKLSDGKLSKNKGPTRLVYSLICTYLHKSVEMHHTEPLWSFVARLKLGKNDLLNGINKWYCPIDNLHLGLIKSMRHHQPSSTSINSLLSIISREGTDVNMSEEEITKLRIKSHYVLDVLSRTKHNLIDLLNSKSQFNHMISICDETLHALGLVEALCIDYAARQCLDSRKATVLSKKYLFPKGNGKPWWMDALTPEAMKLINIFPEIVAKAEKSKS